MENQVIAERIRHLREHYNLSQEDLACIARVTKAAVSRWERSEIQNLKSTSIKNICDYYPELNPAWFLGGSAPMFRPKKEELDLAMTISNRLDTLNEAQLRKLLRFMEEFL